MNPENAAETILDQVARKLTGWKPEDWPQGKYCQWKHQNEWLMFLRFSNVEGLSDVSLDLLELSDVKPNGLRRSKRSKPIDLQLPRSKELGRTLCAGG